MLTLERLIFDPADQANSPNIGAYITADDGTLISATGTSLDVNLTNSLSIDLDGEYSGGNTNPDNVGMIVHSRAASPGDTEQLFRSTGGTLNADALVAANIHAIDVGSFLHGYNGATWDRINSSSGALDINFASQDADIAIDISDLVADDAADAGGSLKVGSRAIDGALSAVSASNDRADQISDMYRRQYVNNSPNIAADVNAVTVGVTQVSLSATPLGGRTSVMIQNNGNKPIFVGPTGVLTTTGIEVFQGGTLSLDLGEDVELFAISGTAGQDVRVLELA